jgi:hypothetical protein
LSFVGVEVSLTKILDTNFLCNGIKILGFWLAESFPGEFLILSIHLFLLAIPPTLHSFDRGTQFLDLSPCCLIWGSIEIFLPQSICSHLLKLFHLKFIRLQGGVFESSSRDLFTFCGYILFFRHRIFGEAFFSFNLYKRSLPCPSTHDSDLLSICFR